MAFRADRAERVERPVPDQADAELVVANDLVVDHQAIADAGAQRHHGEAIEAAACAEPVLVFSEGDEVVLHHGGDAGAGLDHQAEGHVLPAEEGSAQHLALLAQKAANADAERHHLGRAGGECAGEVGDDIGHRVGRAVGEAARLARKHIGPEVRGDAHHFVGHQLHADETARGGNHVEQLLRPADLAVDLLARLDQQAGFEQRGGEAGERAGRQVEPARHFAARQRPVDQHLERHGARRAVAGRPSGGGDAHLLLSSNAPISASYLFCQGTNKVRTDAVHRR